VAFIRSFDCPKTILPRIEAMAQFRLIHISDLHFATQPHIVNKLRDKPGDPTAKHSRRCLQTSHDEEAVRRLVVFLKQRFSGSKEDADLVLISGDLAATGLKSHLQVASGFIFGVHLLTPEAQQHTVHCGISTDELFLMPGNHDRYKPEHWTTRTVAEALEPGGVEFDRVFKEAWPAPKDDAIAVPVQSPETGTAIHTCTRRVIARRVPGGQNVGPPLYVIAADMCLVHEDDAEGTWNGRPYAYSGQGRAIKQIIEAMVELTQRVQRGEPPGAVIWMIHFPPTLEAELRWADRWLRLIGAKHVVAAAKGANVGVILSGHLHVDLTSDESAPVQSWSTGATTCMAFGPPRSLHEIIVTTHENGWVDAERHTYHLIDPEDGTSRTFMKPPDGQPRRHRWHIGNEPPKTTNAA
jgi:hypothetical protein